MKVKRSTSLEITTIALIASIAGPILMIESVWIDSILILLCFMILWFVVWFCVDSWLLVGITI